MILTIRHGQAPPKPPVKEMKPKKHQPPKQEQPSLFERPTTEVVVDSHVSATPSPAGNGPSQEQAPYRALVLARNLTKGADRIDLGEFVLTRVGYPEFQELREKLSSQDVFQNDWLLEKTYPELTGCIGFAPSGFGGIPNDIEDILFMLRLFKVGDVAFVRQAVVTPNGDTLTQYPCRIMNSLKSNSIPATELTENDRERWLAFSNSLRSSQSWGAQWLSVSRRFFLYGGAKEFSPAWDEVDRIVDYVTALEAALVPEGDFSRGRCANRAGKLCSGDPDEQKAISSLVTRLYDLRSSIVLGSTFSEQDRTWLKDNSRNVELRVRQVLLAVVQQSPRDDLARTAFLRSLFDVTDAKRGEFVLQKFEEIETEEVRNETAAEIARLQTKRKRLRIEVTRGNA
jgi:hypothetical protein